MARRTLLALSMVLFVPAALVAQRPGMGGFGRGRIPGSLAKEPGIVIPTQVNAVNLLIQHRQEVALSDSQFVRVIAIKRALDSTNAPVMRKLDSVARLFRGGTPLFSDPSVARRDSLAEARAMVREWPAIVRETNESARDRAYQMLGETQRSKAETIEAAAEKAIADDEAKKKPR
jgi:hypothetical protein